MGSFRWAIGMAAAGVLVPTLASAEDAPLEQPPLPAPSTFLTPVAEADTLTDTGAGTDAALLRYPEQFCTVGTDGDAECVPLVDLPSRATIERLLTELTGRQGSIQTLRCAGVVQPSEDPAAADSETSGAAVPDTEVSAVAADAESLTGQRSIDPIGWNALSVERAEQNILALLRSCHAHESGLGDPVALGSVPSGAPAVRTVVEPPPAFDVQVADAVALDADGVPLNPFEPVPALAAESLAASSAASPAGLSAAKAPPANPFEVVAAAKMVDAPELALDAASGSVASTELEPTEAPVAAAIEPEGVEIAAGVLPDGVRIVGGYDAVRADVASVVVTWLQGAKAARALGIDPCADPIGMLSTDGCELSL